MNIKLISLARKEGGALRRLECGTDIFYSQGNCNCNENEKHVSEIVVVVAIG